MQNLQEKNSGEVLFLIKLRSEKSCTIHQKKSQLKYCLNKAAGWMCNIISKQCIQLQFTALLFSNFLKYLCTVFLPITWKSCYCLYSLNITSKYHMSGVAPMVCWKKLKIKQDSDLYLKSSMLMDLCLWLKLEKTLFGLIFMLNFSFFKCNRFFSELSHCN